MTPKKMREVGSYYHDKAEEILRGDHEDKVAKSIAATPMIIGSTVWLAAAEVCERQDLMLAQQAKEEE